MDAVKKCQKINEESLACVAQYQTKEYLDIEKDLFIKEKLEKKKLYKLYLEKQMQEKQQQQQQEKQGWELVDLERKDFIDIYIYQFVHTKIKSLTHIH